MKDLIATLTLATLAFSVAAGCMVGPIYWSLTYRRIEMEERVVVARMTHEHEAGRRPHELALKRLDILDHAISAKKEDPKSSLIIGWDGGESWTISTSILSESQCVTVRTLEVGP